MKNLIRVSLIKSVGIVLTELSKLQCKLLSAKTAESPKPSMVNSDDFFTSNHQLAQYLHRSDSCVKRYRYLGFIPFINEGGSILVKKSDVDKAVKLYPQLIVSSPVPARPAPRIFIRLAEADNETTFIHFTFQGEKIWIPLAPEKAKDRKAVYSLCQKVIQLLHQIKPFKIPPKETQIAA